jgi:hypothetical protein
MLSRISFSDYKRLKYIELNGLSQVNYLVGEHKSGKSRILEYIDEEFGKRSYFLSEEENHRIFYEGDLSCCHLGEGKNMLIIDEPENHLHPRLQKEIPKTLKYISEVFKLQIFVATHSPFVVGSSAHVTYNERQEHELPRREFVPSQKIYFVKDGQISNRGGESGYNEIGTLKGSYGYWGFKASSIAQKMLGAGLADLLPPQKSSPTNDAPIIVFCEGEGKESDARIYNTIFHKSKDNVLFVSSRGSSQLEQTFEVMQEIKMGLSVNVRFLMLQDRDHLFNSEGEIEYYENTHPGTRILRRRALECYVFNSETVSLFLKSHKLQMSRSNRRKMNTLQRNVQMEAEQGVLGSDYKTRLKDMTKFILKDSGYWTSPRPVSIKNLSNKMAAYVRPGTKTYRELNKTIFNDKGLYV